MSTQVRIGGWPRRTLIPLFVVVTVTAGCGAHTPETLALDAPAPAFSLVGTDGRTHSLGDFASSPVLAIVFTCTHCPASQLYEQRIEALHHDYRDRGVAVVAINPDGPTTAPEGALAYSDVPESLDGMAKRSAHRRLTFPYLYDGDARAATAAFKVVATPQIFIFGADRTLQYVGRIDDNANESRVKTRHARAAIDALLTKQTVPVRSTVATGCPVSPPAASQARESTATNPVALAMAGPAELKALRANGSAKTLLINFWATWCGPCVAEFPALQDIGRTYRSRNVELVTVSIDSPDNKPGVMMWLQERQADSRNYLFATDDIVGLQEAFDPAMPASVPFTLLLAPNGDVLHQQHGEVEFLDLRRAILASAPDPPGFQGLQRYWAN
jgi:thiol-disulfide isomerase/thioredoxin